MNLKDDNQVILKGSNHGLENYNFDNNHEWINAFWFIQMADTQFGFTEDSKTGNDDKWDIEMAYTKQCIGLINNMNPLPEFVIVCGDMIHAFPGKLNREAQISDFLKVFRELHPSIPLICVCGNHDVGNTPTPETLSKYRNDFGDDYLTFWVKGVKFFVINSQLFSDSSKCKVEAEEHHRWLIEQLNVEENKYAKHLVVFQHIPWFINDVNEKDQYLNFEIEVMKSILEKMSQAGISKIFAGHIHKNAGGWFTNSSNKKLELVITSAVGYQLGNDDHGFRVVKVDEKNISHEYQSVFLP